MCAYSVQKRTDEETALKRDLSLERGQFNAKKRSKGKGGLTRKNMADYDC
jgi:hypothetical protein